MLAVIVLSTLAAAASPAHSSKLFSAGELNVTLYRIPVLVALPPDNQTLLAFAEARLPCVRSCGNRAEWGDSSPKHIAFRRSTDGGAHWTPINFIVRSDGSNDNLNLGNVVVDHRKGVVLLQWGGCVHCGCTGTVPKPATCANPHSVRAMQLASSDRGVSWGVPTDISSQVLSADWPVFKFGEGSGLQLPATGDLVVCGRVSNLAGTCTVSSSNLADSGSGTGTGASNCGSACIRSTDSGDSWQQGALIAGPVPGAPAQRGNEAEPALLPNGSILLNMRAGKDRLLGRTDDGGRTFVDVHLARSLAPVADCQGSMQAAADGSGVLLFTAPHDASHQRQNLTLATSHNSGETWRWEQTIHAGPAAYSSLAPVGGRCAALLFEGGAKSRYEHIYFTTVCAQGSDDAEAAPGVAAARTASLKADDSDACDSGGGSSSVSDESCELVMPPVVLSQLGRSVAAHTSYPTGDKSFSVLESFPGQGRLAVEQISLFLLVSSSQPLLLHEAEKTVTYTPKRTALKLDDDMEMEAVPVVATAKPPANVGLCTTCAAWCAGTCDSFPRPPGVIVNAASTESVTVFRMTPRNLTDMLDKDTGDALGDIMFTLYEDTVPMRCAQDPSSKACPQAGGNGTNRTGEQIFWFIYLLLGAD